MTLFHCKDSTLSLMRRQNLVLKLAKWHCFTTRILHFCFLSMYPCHMKLPMPSFPPCKWRLTLFTRFRRFPVTSDKHSMPSNPVCSWITTCSCCTRWSRPSNFIPPLRYCIVLAQCLLCLNKALYALHKINPSLYPISISVFCLCKCVCPSPTVYFWFCDSE